MDFEQQISDFLRKPDWETGLAIYQQVGDNSALSLLFSLGESADSLERMVEYFENRKPSEIFYPKINEEKALENRNRLQQVFAEFKDGSDKTPELALYQQICREDNELFEEAKCLFHELKHVKHTKAERFELAKRIKYIFRRKAELYYQSRYFQKHNRLPPSKDAIEVKNLSDAELLKRKRTLSTYMAPSKAGKIKNLEEKKSELDAIDREIQYRNL